MGTTAPAPSTGSPTSFSKTPPYPAWPMHTMALLGTWFLLGLGTLTATPILPSAVWTRFNTRIRQRHG